MSVDSDRRSEPDGTTLLVIVGCLKESDESPFIVGAFNEEYLNQLPSEDSEEQIQRLKDTWTMEASAYEWRELRVWVADVHIDALFDMPMVLGEILGPDPDGPTFPDEWGDHARGIA